MGKYFWTRNNLVFLSVVRIKICAVECKWKRLQKQIQKERDIVQPSIAIELGVNNAGEVKKKKYSILVQYPREKNNYIY